jgi:hypothetical protein
VILKTWRHSQHRTARSRSPLAYCYRSATQCIPITWIFLNLSHGTPATFSNGLSMVFRPVRSQARPRVAKVAQIAYEVTKQFTIVGNSREWNNTRHKKMALLRGSFTDEEERDKDWRGNILDHTRRRVCSRVLSCKPRRIASECVTSSAKTQRFFFRKREKGKAFSFSIKRNLYSSCSRIYSSIVKTWNSYQEYT